MPAPYTPAPSTRRLAFARFRRMRTAEAARAPAVLSHGCAGRRQAPSACATVRGAHRLPDRWVSLARLHSHSCFRLPCQALGGWKRHVGVQAPRGAAVVPAWREGREASRATQQTSCHDNGPVPLALGIGWGKRATSDKRPSNRQPSNKQQARAGHGEAGQGRAGQSRACGAGHGNEQGRASGPGER